MRTVLERINGAESAVQKQIARKLAEAPMATEAPLITTPSQVGEIIRGRRKARGVPQQELAARLQMSQSRLSTLEGNPAGLTLDRLLVLANLLDLDLVLQDKASDGSDKVEW